MGMTITDSVKELQKWRDGLTYDWGDYSMCDGSISHALDTAIDTMRKYQKIEALFNQYEVPHMRELSLTSGFENALCEVMEDGNVD